MHRQPPHQSAAAADPGPLPPRLDARFDRLLESCAPWLPADTKAGHARAARITLAHSADPERTLVLLERLLHDDAPDSQQPPRQHAQLLARVLEHPRTVEALASLFAGSHFLSERLLRQPSVLVGLLDLQAFLKPVNREELGGALADHLQQRLDAASERTTDALGTALLDFQGEQLLRISIADFLGQMDLPTIAAQLSALADTTITACLERVHQPGEDPALDDFGVLAFGKLGGQELNYSSDVDLVFYSRREGPESWPLARRLLDLLLRTSGTTSLYRVDLRLRPWGRDGGLVVSVDAYLDYLERQARPEELQALLKARPIAGNQALGRELLARARPLLLGQDEHQVRTRVAELKRRIEAQLAERGVLDGEVKSGRGAIRDIEFTAQALQLQNLRHHPQLLTGNTLQALHALHELELVTVADYRVLVSGYVFLRTVEHSLQALHNVQDHSLPRDETELDSLARRLGFRGADARSRFLERLAQHRAAVRSVFARLVENPEDTTGVAAGDHDAQPRLAMPPSYDQCTTEDERGRHAMAAQLLAAERPVSVALLPRADGAARVTIVGHDQLGTLSLICGLLHAAGWNIVAGRVFTSEQPPAAAAPAAKPRRRSKRALLAPPPQPPPPQRAIVDIFEVRPDAAAAAGALEDLERDLSELLRLRERAGLTAAQAELAKRVVLRLPRAPAPVRALQPMAIEFDNESSPHHTVLTIRGEDTPGFLYELTYALAQEGVSIEQMTVASERHRVLDTLWVTSERGRKISSPERQAQLKVTTALTKQFTHLLARSPNPVSALEHFRQLLADLQAQRGSSDDLASLERPEVLERLAMLLGQSDFLWQDFLRLQHETLFPFVRSARALAAPRPRAELERELDLELDAAAAAAEPLAAVRLALNAWKDRELFRIDLRQIFGLCADFEQFGGELTELAEVVLERLLGRLLALAREGAPPALPAWARLPSGLCALGKCGGRELGFASDIELMFLWDDQGARPDDQSALNSLVEELKHGVVARSLGVFEVDLRLRPYGDAGHLAVSLGAFGAYFGPGGDAWPYERQALVKLRGIAGDPGFLKRVLAARDAIVYRGLRPDASALMGMRERQIRHLVTPGTINAKFSPGGLVDVEYLVQSWQLEHGAEHAALRSTNTLEALRAAVAVGAVSPGAAEGLEQHYRFLRRLIDALRMVRGNARDLSVPAAGDELLFLERRLAMAPGDLLPRLERTLRAVRERFDQRFAPPPPGAFWQGQEPV